MVTSITLLIMSHWYLADKASAYHYDFVCTIDLISVVGPVAPMIVMHHGYGRSKMLGALSVLMIVLMFFLAFSCFSSVTIL
jgi:hypothetical protein